MFIRDKHWIMNEQAYLLDDGGVLRQHGGVNPIYLLDQLTNSTSVHRAEQDGGLDLNTHTHS